MTTPDLNDSQLLAAVRVLIDAPGALDAEIVAGLRAFLRLTAPGTFEHKGVVGTFFHMGCGQAHFPADPCP